MSTLVLGGRFLPMETTDKEGLSFWQQENLMSTLELGGGFLPMETTDKGLTLNS